MKKYQKKMLIIEAIPKNNKLNEGIILKEFLKMIFADTPEVIDFKRISSKSQLINYLKNKHNLEEFDYVHFSAHGSKEDYSLHLPKGMMHFSDFEDEVFSRKTVTLSSCELGFKDFAASFCYYTDARYLIAPVNQVSFDDAAVFYINFYHQALGLNHTPKKSFKTCKDYLGNHVQGGFKFFDGKEMRDRFKE
jgi:hypothetical protein